MATKIGINGFGRMGRLALRAGWPRNDLKFVHVNEVVGGPETAAHLLMFDSVHGRWSEPVHHTDAELHIGARSLTYSALTTPGQAPWSLADVDVVLECSGKFRTPESLAPYFDAGVKTVIVAATVKTGALNIVVGVNDHHMTRRNTDY